MIVKYILILFVLFVSCSKNQNNELNETINISVNQLNKLYDAKLIGSGGGSTDNKKRLISLSFIVPNRLTVDQGRKLIIEFSDLILKNVNNEKLKDYLMTYPFTIKNLDISLFNTFEHEQSPTSYPNLFAVSTGKSGIYYFYGKENGVSYIEEESYEEALQKLNANHE